jgi:PAS domain S-box-containing protein
MAEKQNPSGWKEAESLSEAILKAAVDCIPFAFFALNTEGRYILVNAACRTQYGDIVGKTPEEMCPNEQDLALWLDNNRRALCGERIEGEVELTVHGRRRHFYNVVAPIRDGDQIYGVLGVNVDVTERKQAEIALQEANERLEQKVAERTAELTATIEQLGREVQERRRAEEALQRERQTLFHLLQASDHERQLIAYDIHDGLAQQLAAAIMQLQSCQHLKDRQPAEAKTAFDAGVQMVSSAHAEARRLTSGVRPPILDESGLVAAVAHLVHDQRAVNSMRIEYQSAVEAGRLAPILENAVYRIAQEALANACNHSQSKKVCIALVQDGQRLRLEVQDWGIGFDPHAVGENRFGLEGIKERARLLGGELTIDSQPGKGTLIRVAVPILEVE